MNRILRNLMAAVLTVVLLCAAGFQVGAADYSTRLDWAWSSLFAQSADKQVQSLSGKTITSVWRLSDEEVEAISDRLAEGSRVYLVELSDGRNTYYIAVSFTVDDAVYFSNLAVLRKTSHKLYDRAVSLAAEQAPDAVLMDYTHIVGELGLHYAGFRVLDLLGGDKLSGTLGNLYHKFEIADLNLDEDRFPELIRILGLLIGA